MACARCGCGVYQSGDIITLNKMWHKCCFTCCRCKDDLDKCSAKIFQGEVFCQRCYKCIIDELVLIPPNSCSKPCRVVSSPSCCCIKQNDPCVPRFDYSNKYDICFPAEEKLKCTRAVKSCICLPTKKQHCYTFPIPREVANYYNRANMRRKQCPISPKCCPKTDRCCSPSRKPNCQTHPCIRMRTLSPKCCHPQPRCCTPRRSPCRSPCPPLCQTKCMPSCPPRCPSPCSPRCPPSCSPRCPPPRCRSPSPPPCRCRGCYPRPCSEPCPPKYCCPPKQCCPPKTSCRPQPCCHQSEDSCPPPPPPCPPKSNCCSVQKRCSRRKPCCQEGGQRPPCACCPPREGIRAECDCRCVDSCLAKYCVCGNQNPCGCKMSKIRAVCTTICVRCGCKVYAAEKISVTNGAYHTSCFSCYNCRKLLDLKNVYEHCEEIYCKRCYNYFFGCQYYGYGSQPCC